MKKIKKSRVDQNRLRDVSERAFQCIENRDKTGLLKLMEQNLTIALVDIIDHRGYTLLHMICFKNLEDMAADLFEHAKKLITDK